MKVLFKCEFVTANNDVLRAGKVAEMSQAPYPGLGIAGAFQRPAGCTQAPMVVERVVAIIGRPTSAATMIAYLADEDQLPCTREKLAALLLEWGWAVDEE